jgi:site-specific DNA recombinase
MGFSDAVIYARVSSREQEQEGYSIQAQLRLLRAYASKNGFVVVAEFVDVETAKAAGRTHFGEMIRFLSKHPCPRRILVEKTDRLYRNLRDWVTLEDLESEIHLVKEGQVISRDSRSQDRFMHGMQVLLARNTIELQREEVKKGMREKAEQGIYPGRAPFGYQNINRSIEIHPEKSAIVKRIFELYSTGNYSLSTLRKEVRAEFGKTINRAYIHTILTNRVYVGTFTWAGKTYSGNHRRFISPDLFEAAQSVLHGRNKPKYRKHRIAFRGLLVCPFCGSTVTAEFKKGKYVYYRCSGSKGKCVLPRFREEEISMKLGAVLKAIQIPDHVQARLRAALESENNQTLAGASEERKKLEQRLVAVRRRMDQAYSEKLDGKIGEEFWARQMSTWHEEEHCIQAGINRLTEPDTGRLLSLQRILELANKAYFLYVRRKPTEQAELLKLVLLNCGIDGVSVYPTYRKPFDMICERAKREEWSGRADLNCRPLAPQASALPG